MQVYIFQYVTWPHQSGSHRRKGHTTVFVACFLYGVGPPSPPPTHLNIDVIEIMQVGTQHGGNKIQTKKTQRGYYILVRKKFLLVDKEGQGGKFCTPDDNREGPNRLR